MDIINQLSQSMENIPLYNVLCFALALGALGYVIALLIGACEKGIYGLSCIKTSTFWCNCFVVLLGLNIAVSCLCCANSMFSARLKDLCTIAKIYLAGCAVLKLISLLCMLGTRKSTLSTEYSKAASRLPICLLVTGLLLTVLCYMLGGIQL